VKFFSIDITEQLEAAWCDNKITISQILQNKAVDINKTDNLGWTVLGIAAWRGQSAMVAQLLAFDGIQAHTKGLEGSSALFYAAEGGYLDIIVQLLDYGLDVNWRDDNGQTALFCAAETGNLAAIQLLLDSGGRADILDNNGQKAKDLALLYEFVDIAHVLQNAETTE